MFDLESHTGGFTATNSFLIRSEAGALLFDASEGVTEWLERLGVRIDALVLTHQHFDHVMDVAAVKEQHNCPVYAFAPMSADLTLTELLGSFGMPVDVRDFEVDEILEGRATLELAGLKFDVLHVPGHSPDSLCFRPDARSNRGEHILIGGDVLFQRGIGRTDFPHSDTELLYSGIREKLFTLAPETVVYPGHGPWTTIEFERRENPFVAID